MGYPRKSKREDQRSQPLLTTKLYVPSPRPDWVSRPRLLEYLDEALPDPAGTSGRKLVLVSAPAGYGKTTLLAEWLEGIQCPVAWLSLDEGDDDASRFLAYLTAALESIPQFPPSLGPDDSEASGEAQLAALINRASRLSEPVILVLDDFHRVTASTVVEYVGHLLDHLPPMLRIVIATRADPPLPIARLRAGGQLSEIRQADLRFTMTEAAAFLRGAAGVDLSDDQVAALAERTEGWVAGLQMAGVSLRQREDVDSFVDTFAGSHRYVMDYLVEEVLQRQSADVQTFLLQTSILDRLSAPLCDALLLEPPSAGSQSILEDLEQTNLFITPLDDHRIWYRYHRLFADLLRRQLSQRHPDAILELHARASHWYEAHGLLLDSIDHALNAEDFERSALLIERVIEPLTKRSELMTLRNWLGALPEEVLYRRPQLCAYHAWLLLLAGEPVRKVESRIAALREQVGSESGYLKAVQALVSISQGRVDGIDELTDQALQTLTEEDGFWYSVAGWLQDLFRMSNGDLDDEDGEPLRRTVSSYFDGQNVLLGVIGLCNLGELRVKQGRLREAEKTFRRALDRAQSAAGQRLPIAGEPLMWLGDLARERNELSAAERYLTDGLELVRQWGPVAAIEGYTALARLRQAQGDRTGADEALDEAARLAVRFDATEMDDYLVALARARIAALRGDFEAVERWVACRELDRIDPDDLQVDATIELHLRKYELVVLGLARIREGQPRAALTFLDRLLAQVAQKGRWALGIEILALQAVALEMVGETGRALSRLERALSRAEPEGYVRLFIEIGDPMARLLYRAIQAGIFPEYAGRLLATFPEPSVAESVSEPQQPLIEPLSDRELEVLASIAEGLTNQETAQRLCISERTVKWHASNIYGKLQVGNRTEAVARARSLGILPR